MVEMDDKDVEHIERILLRFLGNRASIGIKEAAAKLIMPEEELEEIIKTRSSCFRLVQGRISRERRLAVLPERITKENRGLGDYG